MKDSVKSKYQGVSQLRSLSRGRNMGIKYISKKIHNGIRWQSKFYDTEIAAAKAYDLRLIELGLEPVNILKRK